MNKRNLKIIAAALILVLAMPFVFSACGEKTENAAKTDSATSAETAQTTTPEPTPAPTTPAPTPPPTTETPTEPPTDPSPLADPIVIGDYSIIPGARYYLWSPNSNLYLTCEKESKYTGFTQEAYTGTPNQMFVFEKIREDVKNDKVTVVFKIRALGTKASYLDTDGADGATDGALLLATPTPQGDGSQDWTLKSQKKPKGIEFDLPLFSLMSVISKSTKCVDVNGVSLDEGAYIHLWSGGTANNQKWYFELVADVESGKITPRGKQEITTAAQ